VSFLSNSRQQTSPETLALSKLLCSFSRKDLLRRFVLPIVPTGTLSFTQHAKLLDLADATNTKVVSDKIIADAQDVSVVGFFDAQFPALLREIPDPPLVLYCRGNLQVLNQASISIVGARRCTSQGKQYAHQAAEELTRLGVHVVSGLALGIDGAAHRGALSGIGPGRTIAVLGAALDCMYPSSHERLAQAVVAQGGLLVSEYPPGTPPRAFRFPERNRLISGLGIATVVVEAGQRSGSLITARLAAEQGRDVLAYPGPVDNMVSKGCHRLIQQGAALVTCAQDILAAAGIEAELLSAAVNDLGATHAPAADGLSQPMRDIMACLSSYAVGFDEIAANCGVGGGELAQRLVQLELEGFVVQGPLGYIRTS